MDSDGPTAAEKLLILQVAHSALEVGCISKPCDVQLTEVKQARFHDQEQFLLLCRREIERLQKESSGREQAMVAQSARIINLTVSVFYSLSHISLRKTS